ncbi:MAG: hypothetical protein M3Z03_06930 [Actinomycetota bacterium]|nr:hypothetical protein [Actinomycetota bacterium]
MATPTPPSKLPLGTSPQWEGMHRKIRRVCYVLLFGLVIEGALTFPLLAIWYGVPELSPVEVCSELQKVMYNDDTRECETHPLNSPPLGGRSEAQDQTTSKDIWGVQPTPLYDTVRFRELVRNKEKRDAKAAEKAAAGDGG